MNTCILLATFNGASYLEQQLDSLCMQQGNWCLTIRDDGSSDETVKILLQYQERCKNVSILINKSNQRGACNNFSKLLSEVEREMRYFLFADQDDVWSPHKVSLQKECIHYQEQFSNIPLLVYSDMQVVNSTLQQIHPSFMAYQGIHHEFVSPLQVLLSQNFITGCTMMFNRDLLKFSLPIPQEALMHDWWLALCAATFGQISYIDKPLVKYRQHESNEVGARHIKNLINPFKNNWYQHWHKGKKNLYQSIQQARALTKRIKKHDPCNKNLALIENYATILQLSPWKRIQKLRQLGIHAQSKLRHVLLLARLFSLPTEKQ